MSAAWLKIASFLCLSYIAQTDGGTKTVIWKEVGESITITCNSSLDQEYMFLYTGLNKEVQLMFTDSNSSKIMISSNILARVQTYREFPKVSVLIKNLTVHDTGTYWCVYMKYSNFKEIRAEGDGSLLLVVTGKKGAPTVASVTQQCEPSQDNLVTVSLVVSGVMMLCIVFTCITWVILKKKPSCTRLKSKRAVGNDVYEDMRGTLKR